MKHLLLFLALSSSCLGMSPRTGEARPLAEKEAFSGLAEQILKLGGIAQEEVRETYQISSDEELVLYSYFLHHGDFSQPLNVDWTPQFMFHFGVKSSLAYVKQESIEGFDSPEVLEYKISYRATVDPAKGTITMLDFIENSTDTDPVE